MRVTPTEIHFLPDSEAFARRLARKTEMPARAVAVHRFPDRESLVRVAPSVGRSVALVAQLHDPDPKVLRVLFAVDALRRCGARRVVLLVPYFPYMRQDAVFEKGEALAQQVFAGMIGRAVDEIVTLEPHLHRIRDLAEVAGCGTRTMPAASLLAEWCAKRRGRALLVGPDIESEPWVRSLARGAKLPWVVGRKERFGDRRVRIDFPDLPSANRAILVDDIASSGATLAAASRALRRSGISRVEAVVIHAIFAAGAMLRIRDAGVEKISSCDTIPHSTNAISTAGLFAQALFPKSRAGSP